MSKTENFVHTEQTTTAPPDNWTVNVPQPPAQHVCPNCGYCPCCGRGAHPVVNPWYPMPYYGPTYTPYWVSPPTWSATGTTTTPTTFTVS